MWGRAESIRTTVRTVLEAFAPLVFGLLSAVLVGGTSNGFAAGVNQNHAHTSKASTMGLEYTFLIMLVTLASCGVILLRLGAPTSPTSLPPARQSRRFANGRNQTERRHLSSFPVDRRQSHAAVGSGRNGLRLSEAV
jgi:hypothetical protein